MSLDQLLGKTVKLPIVRFGSPGAFLAVDAARTLPNDDVVLLLGPEVPSGAREGDEVEVFVHRDSEGRPIATTRVPKVELGEVTFLEVTAMTPVGAFVDWGLDKELLVPFAEQTVEPRVGQRYPIGLYIDSSGRLAGTMRISEMVSSSRARFDVDEWVDGEAWRFDPDVGLFVIVERRYVGLVPASEPHGMKRGEAAQFRIAHVHRDGRIELSRRGRAHEELEGDAEKVLALLSGPNAPELGDRSSPDEIRDALGLSKKAFKRAVGRLLRERAVRIDDRGIVRPAR